MAGSAVFSLLPRGCRLPEEGRTGAGSASLSKKGKSSLLVWCWRHKADIRFHAPFWCCSQPCALSSQGSVAVPPHPFPAELVLVFSPQRDTAACATLVTPWTPAASTALVGWQLMVRLLGLPGLKSPFSPSGHWEKVFWQLC